MNCGTRQLLTYSLLGASAEHVIDQPAVNSIVWVEAQGGCEVTVDRRGGVRHEAIKQAHQLGTEHLLRDGRRLSNVAVYGKQTRERLEGRWANADEQHVNCLSQHNIGVTMEQH